MAHYEVDAHLEAMRDSVVRQIEGLMGPVDRICDVAGELERETDMRFGRHHEGNRLVNTARVAGGNASRAKRMLLEAERWARSIDVEVLVEDESDAQRKGGR